MRPAHFPTRPRAATALRLAGLLLLAACANAPEAGAPPTGPAQAPSASTAAAVPAAQDIANQAEFKQLNLTVYGYNYTDTGLGLFQVNGRGGGNLEVSTPTSGGGGSACCVSIFLPFRKDQTVRVKWNRDADLWCEQEVPLRGPVPPDAAYFEVHFYRDGHIETQLTSRPSPPRLKLERSHPNSRHTDPAMNQINDAKASRCQHGG